MRFRQTSWVYQNDDVIKEHLYEIATKINEAWCDERDIKVNSACCEIWHHLLNFIDVDVRKC